MEWAYLFWTAIGFLLGGILFSYRLPLFLKGIDITECSKDGNPGVSNVMKHVGIPMGIFCLFLDLAKGFFPVAASLRFVSPANPLFIAVLTAPVLGHAMAPFNPAVAGGKAITTSFGVLLALLPFHQNVFLLAGLYLLFSLVFPIHPNERRTVITFFLFSLCSLLLIPLGSPAPIAAGCCGISLIVITRNFSDAFFPRPSSKEDPMPDKQEQKQI